MSYQQSFKHLVHYALINDQGQIERCDWRQQKKWQGSAEGKRRSLIDVCRVGNQRIEIRFHGRSETLEQEAPRFWYVDLSVSGRLKRDPAAPRGVGDALRCCREGRRVFFSSGHESPELARKCYQEFAAAVKEGEKARRRLIRLGGPDEVEELLVQVSGWCSEQHGRQTQIAKVIGTKPQTINDWINGRKKPTAKYALRLTRFLYHQVRPAFNAFIKPFENRRKGKIAKALRAHLLEDGR